MSHNLTEVSTYTANVPVPDDGDDLVDLSVEGGLQALANRTKFLKEGTADKFGQYWSGDIGTGAKASGQKFALSQNEQVGGFTLASNEVQVPAAGTYLLTLDLLAFSSGGFPSALAQFASNGAGIYNIIAFQQVDGLSNTACVFHATAVYTITTPASQKISVLSGTSNLSPDPGSSHCRLQIVRIA